MVNLEQIKADIAARKAMPAWGPHTSIERIRTINATLPSFSLMTVDALVVALEKTQRANAAQDDHINQQQDRIDQLENKSSELGRRLYQYSIKPVATLDVQSGRPDGHKFALAYSSEAHKLPDGVYILCCRVWPESVVLDDTKLRDLFDSWFASDCSFDRSPEASEADNIAWRESYWYVWQRCSTAILSVSQLEGL
ncbi:hypothetical protein ACN4GA_08490 [Raoultella terrigena]